MRRFLHGNAQLKAFRLHKCDRFSGFSFLTFTLAIVCESLALKGINIGVHDGKDETCEILINVRDGKLNPNKCGLCRDSKSAGRV